MMTPLELEKLEFDKSMGGYKRASVDDNMLVIRNDYEAIYRENIAHKDKIAVLEGLVAKYKAMEDSMNSAIVLAQQTGENAIVAAREKADSIIKNAEERAEIIKNEAQAEKERIAFETREARKELTVFAAQNISLLSSQIEILKKIGTRDANEEPRARTREESEGKLEEELRKSGLQQDA